MSMFSDPPRDVLPVFSAVSSGVQRVTLLCFQGPERSVPPMGHARVTKPKPIAMD